MFVKNCSVKDISGTEILKFGTKLGNDSLYCVLENQSHIAYQSFYLSTTYCSFVFSFVKFFFLSNSVHFVARYLAFS